MSDYKTQIQGELEEEESIALSIDPKWLCLIKLECIFSDILLKL